MLTLIAQATQQFNDTIPISPAGAGYNVVNISTLINGLMGVGLAIGGFVAFCYLLWGGIIWISAGGDKSKAEQARTIITQSIIGIALLAMMVAFFGIVTDFLGIREKVNVGIFGQTNGGGTTTP